MSNKGMTLNLKVWRQDNPQTGGKLHDYKVENVSSDVSFLEMLDQLNDRLEREGKEPIAFDHDCREGICGACSLFINGQPHGPEGGTTACQLHMRHFKDGDSITIEPFRAKPFPVIRDLVVDRAAFDRIIEAGGYISVRTGSAPDANAIPIPKEKANLAMDAAQCIGCGACVAACKNASASLFVSAKISQMALLPQGKLEAKQRVLDMVQAMDDEGFGHCTNTGACEAECPKEISVDNIARMNREWFKAKLSSK